MKYLVASLRMTQPFHAQIVRSKIRPSNLKLSIMYDFKNTPTHSVDEFPSGQDFGLVMHSIAAFAEPESYQRSM